MYHYVTGIDASSSASLAAYLNTLTFTLGENQVWFGKHPQWRVHSGIYCTYNAFSRVDVRVLVQIPGSVESYVVDERGDKRVATDQIWTETYLSAMVRSLMFADDDSYYYVSCCRRLNPLSTPDSAARFFDAFKILYNKGPSLGASSEHQVATLSSNFLVDAFLKFVQVTGMFDQGLEILQELKDSGEQDTVATISKVLILKNEEVKAVQQLNQGILDHPRNADLLEIQTDFCAGKNRLDLALDSAIRAVNAAPSEFLSWSRLVHIYTEKGDYEQALLTLNSCPMFPHHELDSHRMPAPAKTHLPLPTYGVLDEVWQTPDANEQDIADPGLLKLPAPTLRSTFAKAYQLLTDIVHHIGWDSLLQYRSNVFVMEEEYRKDRKKETHSAHPSSTTALANDSMIVANEPNSAVHLNHSPTNSNDALKDNEVLSVGTPSPKDQADPVVNGSSNGSTVAAVPNPTSGAAESSDKDGVDVGAIKSKRLCERWLDNLFMVLYEDLRVYTLWRAEYVHYQTQQLPYVKTALEWEILGMVADRLRHKDEAKDAFVNSMRQKFSHRVLWKLLDYYQQQNNPAATLDSIVKLTAWNLRWYTEFSPKLTAALRKLVATEGIVKVRSKVEANYSQQGIVDHMEEEFKQLQVFHADGSDN